MYYSSVYLHFFFRYSSTLQQVFPRQSFPWAIICHTCFKPPREFWLPYAWCAWISWGGTNKPYSGIKWQLWRHCVSCRYPWRWYLRYLSYPSVSLCNTSSVNASHLLYKQEAGYSSREPCIIWVRVAKRRKIKFLKGRVMLYFTLYVYVWKLLQLSCVAFFLFVYF